jgi:hypothetical protein
MITELVQATSNETEVHEWTKVENEYDSKIKNAKEIIDLYLNRFRIGMDEGYERVPIKDCIIILHYIKERL